MLNLHISTERGRISRQAAYRGVFHFPGGIFWASSGGGISSESTAPLHYLLVEIFRRDAILWQASGGLEYGLQEKGVTR